MPKVVFVNEHRAVEAPAGKNLRELLIELGINARPVPFNALTCGVFGTCARCQVWVRPGDGEPREPRTLRERLAGMRGERRLSCQVTIGGAMEVTTMAGGADRRMPRPIAPPPQPTVDAAAKRKPIDAAPTAEFVLGHPSAVGSGTRTPEAIANTAPPAKPSAPDT
jgi:ferredoxin